jgi:phosphoglycerate dehydrogenase-like enzyme
MKRGSFLINVANAPIVNRDALIEALRSGPIAGAALDIHYKEPVPENDELLSFDNLILTPRMAGSPRHNGLNDFEELITGLARELAT